MLRILMVLSVVLATVALAALLDAHSQPVPSAETVSPETVQIAAPGRVEGAGEELELRPQLAGRVVRLLVCEGEYVAKGQALLELDSAEYRFQAAQAEAELRLAEAQLARLVGGARDEEIDEVAALHRARLADVRRWKVKSQRFAKLSKSRVIAQQEADDVRNALQSSLAQADAAHARLQLIKADARQDDVRIDKAKVAAAAARMDLARDRLRKATLRAPSGGQILTSNVQVGEITGPDAPQPALVIADTRTMQVRAFVDELDAPRLVVGAAARITVDGLPGRTFTGRVTRLSPRMRHKSISTGHSTERWDTKTRETWISLDEQDSAAKLVVGLRVDVLIDPQTPRDQQHGRPGESESGPSRQDITKLQQ